MTRVAKYVVKSIEENLKVVYLSAILYYSSIIIGFFNYTTSAITSNPQVMSVNSLAHLSNLNLGSILTNNLTLITLLISGSAVLGIPTFNLILYNGIFFGISLANSIQNGTSIFEIYLLTLPHGILEIPAIIIAGAAGFKIPYEIVRYLAGGKEQILTKDDIKEYLTLALISIILITVAAWVEANITLKIARFMLERGGV